MELIVDIVTMLGVVTAGLYGFWRYSRAVGEFKGMISNELHTLKRAVETHWKEIEKIEDAISEIRERVARIEGLLNRGRSPT